MSSKFAAAFGAEFPPCATFPLTNKQVHVQISSSLCSALKFILILKRAALLLATSLRLLFLKPHWEFSPRVFFFFPFQSVHHAAILALSSALGCAKTSFHLYCFLKKRQNGNWGGLKWIHEKLNLWMIPIRFCPFFFIILSLKMIIHWHLSWSQREYFLYFINEPSGYLLWLCCLPVSARVCSVVL